ncbi:MAG TPA: universal stress protein [Saprospiraceae bacterium]|nr:universal stress protein [Saprospiraceae bacterium]
MKVLCPTDFSNASFNACRWMAQLLKEQKNASLELLHCIDVVSRASVFLKTDDIFKEVAERDIAALKEELEKLAPQLEISTRVVNLSPKAYTTDYAKRKAFDLIVTGTKGLSALKEVTVGSVTAYLMDHAKIPVLAIPEEATYDGLNHIVLGIDDDGESTATLAPLVRLVEATQARLEIVHTTNKKETVPVDSSPLSSLPLGEINYSFSTIPEERSIPETLTNYSVDQDADIMVMVHRRRNFMERFFVGSFSREGLFIIKTPLLILPQLG